eukprot:TRINITY_DN11331_c0_g1_i5.p1 TRINITY_DN11331_c0_g1~~TRINITY_DN11331_c0_g1_i5.p1  ORF type:complete len:109 (+),score=7.80 TRINITY_DN11331_c0_g1_i5:538-864(+)
MQQCIGLNTEALVERQPLLNPSAAVSNKPKCQLNIGDALCIFLFIGYTVALCVQALGRRFVIELYYAHLACLAALQLAQVWFWYAVVTYKGVADGVARRLRSTMVQLD